MQITIAINKDNIYEQIAQNTSWIGAKSAEAGAYDRIFTTDEDKEQLELYWKEAKDTLLSKIKSLVDSNSETNNIFTLTLNVSSRFKFALLSSIQSGIESYFENIIIAKWFNISYKTDVQSYATDAATYLDDVKKKLYYKDKPRRPSY